MPASAPPSRRAKWNSWPCRAVTAAAHQPLDEGQVAVALECCGKFLEGGVDAGVLREREQPAAHLGDLDVVDVREGAQDRQCGPVPDSVLGDAATVVAGHVVEDHADEVEAGCEGLLL